LEKGYKGAEGKTAFRAFRHLVFDFSERPIYDFSRKQ
jgi:hypothetical protein